MMELIVSNYEWIFSGIGVLLISLFLRSKNTKNNQEVTNETTHNLINEININPSAAVESGSGDDPQIPIYRRKEDCKILFIDDDTKWKMPSILKKAGWTNTKIIKDLLDLDHLVAREADIIFVDIHGVGTQMYRDEGLGLAVDLKDKYPRKTIILYSSETTGDRFDKKLKKVDNSIAKNADPFEFVSLIEQYIHILQP